MAIKRPSKSRGGPVRKATTTVPVRHVDVLATPRMVPGETYVGWLCKNRQCGRLIAIAPPPAGAKAGGGEFDAEQAAVKCPHCGDEDLYRWSARGELVYRIPDVAG